MTISMDQLVKPNMNNILKLHATLTSIVSNRDAMFIARLWKEFQEAMRIELKLVQLSIQRLTRGQSMTTFQILED